jgi:hypothetical protein
VLIDKIPSLRKSHATSRDARAANGLTSRRCASLLELYIARKARYALQPDRDTTPKSLFQRVTRLASPTAVEADMSGTTRFRLHAILSAPALLIALLLSIIGSGSAVALGQECMAGYYLARSTACVDGILADFRQKPRSDPNTLLGFLAELFKDSRQERDRILKAETSDFMKSVELTSLWLAGQPEEARKFAEALNKPGLIEQVRQTFPASLDAVKPSMRPRDNDLLVGAYMASGDTDFIKRILANYTSADDGMVADALRVGFLIGKFGPNISPPGRTPATLQAACEKYQCKIDRTRFPRLLTLATAIWTTQSLSQHDQGIGQTLNGFFSGDARLNRIFMIEQTAFGNYLTALIVTTTFQNTQASDEQRSAFATMDQSATIYESLGSAADATAVMMQPSPK